MTNDKPGAADQDWRVGAAFVCGIVAAAAVLAVVLVAKEPVPERKWALAGLALVCLIGGLLSGWWGVRKHAAGRPADRTVPKGLVSLGIGLAMLALGVIPRSTLAILMLGLLSLLAGWMLTGGVRSVSLRKERQMRGRDER